MPVYKMVDTCAGEFTSATHTDSSYEQENESSRQRPPEDRRARIGTDPYRTGRGVRLCDGALRGDAAPCGL